MILLPQKKWKIGSKEPENRQNLIFATPSIGWHLVMEFSPSLIGCIIANNNVSFEMIRKSGVCVINVPTADMVDQVVGIGNCDGDKIDKFEKFALTPVEGLKVAAPLIEECFANLECRIVDKRLLKKYNFFILEVVKAHVAKAPKYPQTLHYRGEGISSQVGVC